MKLIFEVNKPCDEVLPYLTDMTKYVLISPVIYQIDHLGDNRYWSHETLKAGFIPFTFTYPFTVESSPADKIVRMKAVVMKLVHIELTFIVSSVPEGTIIEETVQIDTFLPIKTVLEKIFKKQHRLMFKNLEEHH